MTTNDTMRELLDELGDHVSRFGGIQWLRDRGEDVDELIAYSGEPLGEHLERIRTTVKADIDARIDRATADFAAWAGSLGWPLYEDGTPVMIGDVVCLADSWSDGAVPCAVTGVEVGGDGATMHEGRHSAVEVKAGRRLRRATEDEMTAELLRLARRGDSADPCDELEVIGAYAGAIARAMGGGDGGR